MRISIKTWLIGLMVILILPAAACGTDDVAAPATAAPTPITVTLPTTAPALTATSEAIPSIRVLDAWARPAGAGTSGMESMMSDHSMDDMGDATAMPGMDSMKSDDAMGGMADATAMPDMGSMKPEDSMDDMADAVTMPMDSIKPDDAMDDMADAVTMPMDPMKSDDAMGDMTDATAMTGMDTMMSDEAMGDMGSMAGMDGMGSTGAIYFRLVNDGDAADALVAVTDVYCKSTGEVVATSAEMHESSMDSEGLMSMKQVQNIPIPASGSVELEPGGLHVMLLDLQSDLIPGDIVLLTLDFEISSNQVIEAIVREP